MGYTLFPSHEHLAAQSFRLEIEDTFVLFGLMLRSMRFLVASGSFCRLS